MRAVITFNEKITIEPGQKLKEIEKQLLQTILTTHLRMPKRTSEDISWYGMDTVYIHRPFGLYQKNYVEVGDKHNIYLNESLGLALKQSKENKLVVVANSKLLFLGFLRQNLLVFFEIFLFVILFLFQT